jgi:hypothetical protein
MMQWMRKAAENGLADDCLHLADDMYKDKPYAREVGHVEESAGVASSAGFMEGHHIPPDVMTSVLYWLRKGGARSLVNNLDVMRSMALEGGTYCHNESCEVVGLLKDFKVCPQRKTARYCGDACQKLDWNAGGHKEMCGTFRYKGRIVST